MKLRRNVPSVLCLVLNKRRIEKSERKTETEELREEEQIAEYNSC